MLAVTHPNHMASAARRKLKITSLMWKPSSYQALDDGTILIVGSMTRLITRGRNKGRPVWDSTSHTTCTLTQVDLREEERIYEKETGKCHACDLGHQVASIGIEGIVHKPCKRCNATGIAPVKETV